MIELPHAMQRHTQVLLVMDVVESVRLMEQDQDSFVRRWQQLVRHAEREILPRHGGHIIKSMGDGLMLAFSSPVRCAQAAYALLNFCQQTHVHWRPAEQMHLRMGCHLASFVADCRDIYGTDVNLTARLCTSAGPGDIVVSADIRHRLVPGLDAEIEDLGERYLKHVAKPVHAYRIVPPGMAFAFTAQPVIGNALQATFAVMPMTGPQTAFPG